MLRFQSIFFATLLSLAHPAAGAGLPHDFASATAVWDKLVSQHVKPTGVDYQGLANDEAKLAQFIGAHEKLAVTALSDAEKKAVYINLYNAGMMYNLLKYAKAQKIDVKSKAFTEIRINDISVPGGNIWNGSYKFKLQGHEVTLDNIEHGLLRREADGALKALMVKTLDPRIHAAVNCAAMSCPPVRNRAYTPANVEAMLTENMENYLSADYQFRKVDDDTMQANSIVYWYYGDFDQYAQDVLKKKGAGEYLEGFIRASAKDADWKKRHLRANFNNRSKFTLKLSSAFTFEYEWKVNDIRNGLPGA